MGVDAYDGYAPIEDGQEWARTLRIDGAPEWSRHRTGWRCGKACH